MNAEIRRLETAGHICILLLGPEHPPRLEWCEREPCAEIDIRAKQVEADAKVIAETKRLQNEGHTCVYIKESLPARVGWCNSTPCKESYDKKPTTA